MKEEYKANEYELEPQVMESEVRKALAEIKNNKATGTDGIPIELIRGAGEEGVRVVTQLCQSIWKTTTWPKDWKKSVYIPIPKKGDIMECANHRTIALIS